MRLEGPDYRRTTFWWESLIDCEWRSQTETVFVQLNDGLPTVIDTIPVNRNNLEAVGLNLDLAYDDIVRATTACEGVVRFHSGHDVEGGDSTDVPKVDLDMVRQRLLQLTTALCIRFGVVYAQGLLHILIRLAYLSPCPLYRVGQAYWLTAGFLQLACPHLLRPDNVASCVSQKRLCHTFHRLLQFHVPRAAFHTDSLFLTPYWTLDWFDSLCANRIRNPLLWLYVWSRLLSLRNDRVTPVPPCVPCPSSEVCPNDDYDDDDDGLIGLRWLFQSLPPAADTETTVFLDTTARGVDAGAEHEENAPKENALASVPIQRECMPVQDSDERDILDSVPKSGNNNKPVSPGTWGDLIRSAPKDAYPEFLFFLIAIAKSLTAASNAAALYCSDGGSVWDVVLGDRTICRGDFEAGDWDWPPLFNTMVEMSKRTPLSWLKVISAVGDTDNDITHYNSDISSGELADIVAPWPHRTIRKRSMEASIESTTTAGTTQGHRESDDGYASLVSLPDVGGVPMQPPLVVRRSSVTSHTTSTSDDPSCLGRPNENDPDPAGLFAAASNDAPQDCWASALEKPYGCPWDTVMITVPVAPAETVKHHDILAVLDDMFDSPPAVPVEVVLMPLKPQGEWQPSPERVTSGVTFRHFPSLPSAVDWLRAQDNSLVVVASQTGTLLPNDVVDAAIEAFVHDGEEHPSLKLGTALLLRLVQHGIPHVTACSSICFPVTQFVPTVLRLKLVPKWSRRSRRQGGARCAVSQRRSDAQPLNSRTQSDTPMSQMPQPYRVGALRFRRRIAADCSTRRQENFPHQPPVRSVTMIGETIPQRDRTLLSPAFNFFSTGSLLWNRFSSFLRNRQPQEPRTKTRGGKFCSEPPEVSPSNEIVIPAPPPPPIEQQPRRAPDLTLRRPFIRARHHRRHRSLDIPLGPTHYYATYVAMKEVQRAQQEQKERLHASRFLSSSPPHPSSSYATDLDEPLPDTRPAGIHMVLKRNRPSIARGRQ